MSKSCWITATSYWLSRSAEAATDAVDPLTNSPTTRESVAACPSAIRTMPTSAPLAVSPPHRAALNIARPHIVGVYVVRTPKLGDAEFDSKAFPLPKERPRDKAVKMDFRPCDCHKKCPA